jgi:hypothetical protein
MGFPAGTNPLTTPIITPIIDIPHLDIPNPTILITDAGLIDPDKDVGQTHNTWQRIEPVPLSPDLTFALQAAVAGPAWMLCRQWQFLEFAATMVAHHSSSREARCADHAIRVGARRFNSVSRARPFWR